MTLSCFDLIDNLYHDLKYRTVHHHEIPLSDIMFDLETFGIARNTMTEARTAWLELMSDMLVSIAPFHYMMNRDRTRFSRLYQRRIPSVQENEETLSDDIMLSTMERLLHTMEPGNHSLPGIRRATVHETLNGDPIFRESVQEESPADRMRRNRRRFEELQEEFLRDNQNENDAVSPEHNNENHPSLRGNSITGIVTDPEFSHLMQACVPGIISGIARAMHETEVKTTPDTKQNNSENVGACPTRASVDRREDPDLPQHQQAQDPRSLPSLSSLSYFSSQPTQGMNMGALMQSLLSGLQAGFPDRESAQSDQPPDQASENISSSSGTLRSTRTEHETESHHETGADNLD